MKRLCILIGVLFIVGAIVLAVWNQLHLSENLRERDNQTLLPIFLGICGLVSFGIAMIISFLDGVGRGLKKTNDYLKSDDFKEKVKNTQIEYTKYQKEHLDPEDLR